MTPFCQWSHKIKTLTIFRRLKLILDFRFTEVILIQLWSYPIQIFLFRNFKTVSDLQMWVSKKYNVNGWVDDGSMRTKNIKEAIYNKRKEMTHSMGWDGCIWSILKIRCKSVYQYYFEINFPLDFVFILLSDWNEFEDALMKRLV